MTTGMAIAAAEAAEAAMAPRTVEASLNYIENTGERPVTYLDAPGEQIADRSARFVPHRMTIHDARKVTTRFSLEREGFTLVEHESAVSDFFDEDALRAVYYPEVEALVKAASGAKRVLMFDHTIRVGDDGVRTAHKVREPVPVVHNDYTERSAPQRVRDLLPADEAEALVAGRFAVIQLWRPLAPVRDTPLAICDAQSIAPEDLIATELRYQNRVGEIYQLAHNPAHRWYYFRDLEPNEALIFKCYDSLADGRARFTAHSAFEDPNAAPGAPRRQSIEARALAFF